MFLFGKKKASVKQIARKEESPKIGEARKYLENIHHQSLKYLKKIKKGEHTRYLFCKRNDERYVYVALSEAERNEIIKDFKQKMGDGYAYQDTMILNMYGSNIQHRFYIPNSFNSSITFMTDDGKVWGGHFSKGEDFF